MKKIRLLHLYMGVFFTPAILFFAVTGAFMTFGYHETSRGSNYQPPAWIVSAGLIHKKQGLNQSPSPEAVQSTPSPTPTGAPPPKAKIRESWPLKWFVLFTSLGLIGTTLLGLYLAFKYHRGLRLIVGLLAAGTLLPVVLLYI